MNFSSRGWIFEVENFQEMNHYDYATQEIRGACPGNFFLLSSIGANRYVLGTSMFLFDFLFYCVNMTLKTSTNLQ